MYYFIACTKLSNIDFNLTEKKEKKTVFVVSDIGISPVCVFSSIPCRCAMILSLPHQICSFFPTLYVPPGFSFPNLNIKTPQHDSEQFEARFVKMPTIDRKSDPHNVTF